MCVKISEPRRHFLLNPVQSETLRRKGNRDTTKTDIEHIITHSTNRDQHTLLYLVSLHREKLFHTYSILIDLEYQCHQDNVMDIKRCLRQNLGSSKQGGNSIEH